MLDDDHPVGHTRPMSNANANDPDLPLDPFADNVTTDEDLALVTAMLSNAGVDTSGVQRLTDDQRASRALVLDVLEHWALAPTPDIGEELYERILASGGRFTSDLLNFCIAQIMLLLVMTRQPTDKANVAAHINGLRASLMAM